VHYSNQQCWSQKPYSNLIIRQTLINYEISTPTFVLGSQISEIRCSDAHLATGESKLHTVASILHTLKQGQTYRVSVRVKVSGRSALKTARITFDGLSQISSVAFRLTVALTFWRLNLARSRASWRWVPTSFRISSPRTRTVAVHGLRAHLYVNIPYSLKTCSTFASHELIIYYLFHH